MREALLDESTGIIKTLENDVRMALAWCIQQDSSEVSREHLALSSPPGSCPLRSSCASSMLCTAPVAKRMTRPIADEVPTA